MVSINENTHHFPVCSLKLMYINVGVMDLHAVEWLLAKTGRKAFFKEFKDDESKYKNNLISFHANMLTSTFYRSLDEKITMKVIILL